MAAYPSTYGYKINSIEPDDGSELTRADDGTQRIRRLYGEVQYRITFTHPLVSHADYQTILTFYETNKGDVITWTDPTDSVVYDCLMKSPPRKSTIHNGVYCDVRMVLEGTVSA